MLDKDNKAAQKFKALHKSVMDKFLQFETSLKPIHDKWEKPELGEGYSIVIDGGEFFDKAGINFSQILLTLHLIYLQFFIKFKTINTNLVSIK